MDSSMQWSIAYVVTSAVATAVVAIQFKYDDNMLFLRKLIKRSLLLKDFPSTTPSSNSDAVAKTPFSTNILLKTSIKR